MNNDTKVNIIDALLIAQYAAGLDPANFNMATGDMNADGAINIIDAMLIAQQTVTITPIPTPSATSTPRPTCEWCLRIVSGTVKDTLGQPIAVASLTESFKVLALTDGEGKFTYTMNARRQGGPANCQPDNAYLDVSASGHQYKTLSIPGGCGDYTYDIVLTPLTSPAPTPGPTSTSTPITQHLANPFVVSPWYVNPDWATRVTQAGGAIIAKYNTAVWLNSLSSVTYLENHLDSALTQNAKLITLVIYDLPNRRCQVSGFSDFTVELDGLNRYRVTLISHLFT